MILPDPPEPLTRRAHGAHPARPRATVPLTAPSSHSPDPAPRHAAGEPAATPVVGHADAAIVAQGLRLATLQGRVFGPADVEIPGDRHGAVLGVQGSGRSTFLLALAGRMKGVEGSLRVGDLDGLRHPRRLRHRVAVARIADLVGLEPSLTVAETVDEHALLEGTSIKRGRQVVRDLSDVVGLRLDPDAQVASLPAVHRTLLTALLGCQRPSAFIVLDDVDELLTAEQLEEVYDAIDVLGGLGHRFVVSALASSPVPRGAATVTLTPPEDNEGLALSFDHLRHRRTPPSQEDS